MRNTKVPLVCLAWAQLKRAVRIRPTCGVPVGDGQNRTRTGVSAVTSRVASRVISVVAVLETASGAVGVVIVVPTLPRARRGIPLQNRTAAPWIHGAAVRNRRGFRAAVWLAADHRVGEASDALDLDLEAVTGLDQADAGRGAGPDDVARQQGERMRDDGHQLAHAADHLAGAAVLAEFAVETALDLQVLGVQLGLDPRAQRRGGVEALGPRPLQVRLLDVPGGEVVAAGVAEDDVVDPVLR